MPDCNPGIQIGLRSMPRHSGSLKNQTFGRAPIGFSGHARTRAQSRYFRRDENRNRDRNEGARLLLRGCPISTPKTLPATARDSPTSPTRARLSVAWQNYPRHTRLSFTTRRHHVRCYHEHNRRARRQGTRRGRSRARDGARKRSRLTRLWTLTREKDAAMARHRRGVAPPRASDARVSLDQRALC